MGSETPAGSAGRRGTLPEGWQIGEDPVAGDGNEREGTYIG